MATCNAQDNAGWYCLLTLGHYPATDHRPNWPRPWKPAP